MTLRAWWDPGWYNLDQPLKVGRRDTFAFFRSQHVTKPGYDVVIANTMGSDWDYRSATVEAIEHARFGPLDEVDTTQFGQYTFRFHDGRWVTIEAEEGPGCVNAASPDFPADVCDRAWADNSGWALTVVLSDVTEAVRPGRRRPWSRLTEAFSVTTVGGPSQRPSRGPKTRSASASEAREWRK